TEPPDAVSAGAVAGDSNDVIAIGRRGRAGNGAKPGRSCCRRDLKSRRIVGLRDIEPGGRRGRSDADVLVYVNKESAGLNSVRSGENPLPGDERGSVDGNL